MCSDSLLAKVFLFVSFVVTTAIVVRVGAGIAAIVIGVTIVAAHVMIAVVVIVIMMRRM